MRSAPRAAARARRGGLLLAILAAPCALALACIQDDGSRFNPIQSVVPSLDEDAERELGMEFDRALEEHVSVVHDHEIAGFLTDLGQSIVETIDPQPFIYRFRVVVDPSLNAFAVPGGYVYFHSGTILAAGSVDELAGVMGHEIAHVKAHHYARMRKRNLIPDLLAGVVGLGAAVATGEPGFLVLSQAVNVALKLSYSRELEAEADQLGGIFVSRAGYDPAGVSVFFERILAEKRQHPLEIPPYLFSHPDVEDRIATTAAAAGKLRPTRERPPGMEEALFAAQARLARLVDTGRSALPSSAPAADRSRTDPLLARAAVLAGEGDADDALVLLARAGAEEPYDPRVPFRIGELRHEQGRFAEAAEAYERTVELDPSRAQVFYKLGLAHRELAERHQAVYAFEQAARRAGETSVLRKKAEWEIEKLTFPVVPEAGFADGRDTDGMDTPVGTSRERFPTGTRRLAWWARLHPRFVPYAREMRVRWRDPSGAVVREERVDRHRKPYVGSVLELGRAGAAPGRWTVELLLQGDVADRRSVVVAGAEGAAAPGQSPRRSRATPAQGPLASSWR